MLPHFCSRNGYGASLCNKSNIQPLSDAEGRERQFKTTSGRKYPRTKDYDYLVNPAPDSLLSSMPDSLVDNIPQIPMDAEKEDNTDKNKCSDTASQSKEPPQTDARKDTC